MNIEVFVTPEMKRDLIALKAAREAALGEKWTLREIYTHIMQYGIRDAIAGLDDGAPEMEAFKAAHESRNHRGKK